MELEKYGAVVKLLVDHPDQVLFLEEYENQQEKPQRWFIFIKINGGQKYARFIDLKVLKLKPLYLSRAGVHRNSQAFSRSFLVRKPLFSTDFTVMLVIPTGQLHYPRHQHSYRICERGCEIRLGCNSELPSGSGRFTTICSICGIHTHCTCCKCRNQENFVSNLEWET